MTIKTLKFLAGRWLALSLSCGLTLSLAAQQRSGGSSGGAARPSSSAGAGAACAGAVDRPANGEVGTANFSVDPDTHRMIVTADEQTAAYISQVVSNLDRPKPQVLIKVVFLQVTYNNGYD